MTALQHVYVTAHGSWQSGPWVGESAQFGVRLATVLGTEAPAKGTVFTLPEHGDVVLDQGSEAGTNGTLTRTWTARRGVLGSDENFDAGWQIGCAEDVVTFLNAIKSYWAPAFAYTHVKLAPVGANGKTLQPSSVYSITPIAGAGSGTLPPQVAYAVSMRANLIGRRGRGRIYLPAIAGGSALAADGTAIGGFQTGIRTAFVALVNNLQNLPGAPDYLPFVTIMSPGLTTGVRPSQVRTGNRFDTIRSRREQVAEAYGFTAL